MNKLSNIDKFTILIIAAGMGKRMGKIGKKIPKCLIKINDLTLIERNLLTLKSLGIKKVNIIVGYKFRKIKSFLNKKKILKINFIRIDNYKYGHSYTLYYFKKFWNKLRKPLLFLHADIIYKDDYLINIINSPKKNIIGVKYKKNHQIRSYGLVVKINKKSEVIMINMKKKVKNFYGEILGINKFSVSTLKKIYSFMDKFFKNKVNKRLAWEIFLDIFVKSGLGKFYVLRSQQYPWININNSRDLQNARKLVFKI